MYIKTVRIRNYKIHRDTAVKLFPITVFVGPNGGGKSSIFDALVNYSMVCRGPVGEAFSGWPYSFESVRHRAATATARIGYEVEMVQGTSGQSIHHKIQFGETGGGFSIHSEELSVGDERVFSRDDDVCEIDGIDSYIGADRSVFAAIRRARIRGEAGNRYPDLVNCAASISLVGRYRLDPGLLARPGRLPDVDPEDPGRALPRISYRGEDLASVLYFLAETGDDALVDIQTTISEAVEGFESIEFNRVGPDRVGFSVVFSDGRGRVPAPALSDGTLSVIGMITLANAPGKQDVLCIEEPENGMTPRATRPQSSGCRAVGPGRVSWAGADRTDASG